MAFRATITVADLEEDLLDPNRLRPPPLGRRTDVVTHGTPDIQLFVYLRRF